MNQQNELATLRTGVEVPKAMVNVTLISLRILFARHPIALYELVKLARDPQHRLWGNTATRLEELAFIEGGRMNNVVRDVVLAATEGEDEICLVNPLGA